MESQQELQSEPWTDGPPIRVRIGVHTGEVEERDGNYFGPALNCAARLMGAAHGGQLVVSEVTARLLPRRDEEDNSELPVAPIAWVGASSCFELPSVLWAGGPTVLWDGGPTWRALNSSVVLGALDANHQADQQGVVEQGPMPGVSGQRDLRLFLQRARFIPNPWTHRWLVIHALAAYLGANGVLEPAAVLVGALERHHPAVNPLLENAHGVLMERIAADAHASTAMDYGQRLTPEQALDYATQLLDGSLLPA